MGAQITFLFIFCSAEPGTIALHWHNTQAFQHLDIISCLLTIHCNIKKQIIAFIHPMVENVPMLRCSLIVSAYVG